MKYTKEQLRMQQLAGIITESQFKVKLNEDYEGENDPTSGPARVYSSNSELYKIENFPSISNAIDIDLPCGGDESCDPNDPIIKEFKRLVSNKAFKDILYKIQNDEFNQDENWDSVLGIQFHGIGWDGDFSSPLKTAYAQVSGDGFLYIVDSLSRFDEGYQEEKDWGIKGWNKI